MHFFRAYEKKKIKLLRFRVSLQIEKKKAFFLFESLNMCLGYKIIK